VGHCQDKVLRDQHFRRWRDRQNRLPRYHAPVGVGVGGFQEQIEFLLGHREVLFFDLDQNVTKRDNVHEVLNLAE
jgi:hypothetical protein